MSVENKILYVSCMCSDTVFDSIFKSAENRPGQAVQKFHRLLIEGFCLHKNRCQVETLSSIPVDSGLKGKLYWFEKKEIFNNIKFNYIPVLKIPVVKELIVVLYSFFKVLFWNLNNCKKNRVIICDVLNLSASVGSLIAGKFTRTKVVAIVTDLPGLMLSIDGDKGLKMKLFNNITKRTIKLFNGYILLTKQMNEIVNPKNRPYLIMEGLVDVKMSATVNSLSTKTAKKVLMYAGGIYEKYGVKKLIDAFMLLKDNELELHIYGSGEMEKDMDIYTNQDCRIIYKGEVPNSDVVKSQLNATLLINPRPSDEEFAKYSFPSKNMEYMVSGTPVLTTALPGMPKEYNDFVYIFEGETIQDMYSTLKKILSLDLKKLHELGQQAKVFVLENKSNYIQSGRILDFLNF